MKGSVTRDEVFAIVQSAVRQFPKSDCVASVATHGRTVKQALAWCDRNLLETFPIDWSDYDIKGKSDDLETRPATHCGESIDDHWEYCPSCGARLDNLPDAELWDDDDPEWDCFDYGTSAADWGFINAIVKGACRSYNSGVRALIQKEKVSA